MKKALYIVLLIAEAVAGFLAINLAWVNLGWAPCAVTLAVWAALMTRQVLLLKRSAHGDKKKKIYRNIALVMLVPIAGFMIMLIWLIVGLSMVI